MTTSKAPPFKLHFSRRFDAWLADFNASIAFSTYQAGKVFFIGHGDQCISITELDSSGARRCAARRDPADAAWVQDRRDSPYGALRAALVAIRAGPGPRALEYVGEDDFQLP
ncbi:MAG: hypothetical protein Kow0020_16030 [Wenzhouxiangellaceae bacterium]